MTDPEPAPPARSRLARAGGRVADFFFGVASAEDARRFQELLIGLTPVAVVAAFASQPILRFASPAILFGGALLIMMALTVSLALRIVGVARAHMLLILLVLVLAAMLLFVLGTDALRRSDWNDARCFRIQGAMLNPGPETRSDLPDLFTALGCRPQGGPPPALAARRPPPPGTPSRADYERERARAIAAEVRIDRPPDARR